MKITPILFSTAMVQAILNGSKTQTRRTVKIQPELTKHSHISKGVILDGKNREVFMYCTGKSSVVESVKCPYGQVDDILWVRETMIKNDGYTYWPVADGYKKNTFLDKVIPSIFMPKKACRIFLRVKSVRIEQLKSISESDAIAEGIERAEDSKSWKDYFYKDIGNCLLASTSYLTLWQSINKVFDPIDDNPFVWVVEFERIDKPNDF